MHFCYGTVKGIECEFKNSIRFKANMASVQNYSQTFEVYRYGIQQIGFQYPHV